MKNRSELVNFFTAV